MNVLVISPHPDDEVLGAGGTLLRRQEEGHHLGWLIVTRMCEGFGWTTEQIARRQNEIKKVKDIFKFEYVLELEFPSTQLDDVPMSKIVDGVSKAFADFQPNEIFIPHPGDIHSDHKKVFEAVASSSKWFRSSSINRILSYETLSETDFGLSSGEGFVPNFFVDISSQLDRKIKAMKIYESEIGIHPFPRSEDSIRALACIRGASSGFVSAEAFQLWRERL